MASSHLIRRASTATGQSVLVLPVGRRGSELGNQISFGNVQKFMGNSPMRQFSSVGAIRGPSLLPLPSMRSIGSIHAACRQIRRQSTHFAKQTGGSVGPTVRGWTREQEEFETAHEHTVLPLWLIKETTKARIPDEFHIATVHYDTPTGTPKLVIQLPTATADLSHNSIAIPLGDTMPVALLESLIKDETHDAVKDVRIYDCRAVPDESDKQLALLEPNYLWSKYTLLDELIRESLHGTSQGFFVFLDLVPGAAFPQAHEMSAKPNPAPRGERVDIGVTAERVVKYYVRIPQFEQRVAPLRREIAELKQEYDVLDSVKRELDQVAAKSGSKVAILGFSSLVFYWCVMFHYVFFTEYGWDVMEPISYFFGVGFAICSYAWWLLFSKEYTYDSLKHVALTQRQTQLYSQRQFDLRRHERLQQEINVLEKQIESIKVLYKESSV